MPIFVTQGRYSPDAIKGMIANPEDRAEAVSKLAQQAGGRMLAYYVTLGEYDFLVVCEMPGHKEASMVVLTAAASGGVTDVKTTLTMTTAEAKEVFTATGKLALELPSGRRGQLTWLTQPKIG
jgi:uncharacterized protein with GYD domain